MHTTAATEKFPETADEIVPEIFLPAPDRRVLLLSG
jgi:hypothetical protein